MGIQSTSSIQLISSTVAPQQHVCVCEKGFMEKRVQEDISVVRWAVSCCHLSGWGCLECACLHPVLSQSRAQAMLCLLLSVSPVYLGVIHSYITPVLKICHSFCVKELLMSTDDSTTGRSELVWMPGEKKGLFY